MQYTAFNLPVKQNDQVNYAKYQSNPLQRPVYRSQSSNVEVGNHKGLVQMFRPNEPTNVMIQAPNPLVQPFDAAHKVLRNSVTNTNNISQGLYQNGNYQHQYQSNTNGVSIYQQNSQNPSVQLNNYNTNPAPGYQPRVQNMSEQYNRFTSVQEPNKSRDIGMNKRFDNDNLSVHSKISTTSRNQLLRPVSINNDDHLFNLANKEERLATQNTELINNFVKNVNNTKFNVITNMGQNFKQRIGEIWSSYVNEQQRGQATQIDMRSLEGDVNRINAYFMENLSLKTQQYIEMLKDRCYQDLYKSLDEKNNQRLYLDNDLKDLVEINYRAAERRNGELRNEADQARNQFESQIDQTEHKYEKLRETHMELYDREFTFKLNSDDKLVRETLMNAIPSLQGRKRKLDEKLQYIQAKSDYRNVAQLKGEIAALEAKLRDR